MNVTGIRPESPIPVSAVAPGAAPRPDALAGAGRAGGTTPAIPASGEAGTAAVRTGEIKTSQEETKDKTQKSFHEAATLHRLRALDLKTKETVAERFVSFAQEAEGMMVSDDPAYRTDEIYAMALKVWKDHDKKFFTHAEKPADDEKPKTEKPAGAEKSKEVLNFDDFTVGELIVVDGVLRKMANQLAAATGHQIAAPHRRIPATRKEGGILGLGTHDVDITSSYNWRSLRTGGYLAGLPNLTLHRFQGAYAERIRFHEKGETEQIQKLIATHNAEIALREQLTGFKDTDAAFHGDRLSVEIARKVEGILQNQYSGADRRTLTDRENIEIQERATTSAVTELARSTAFAILENKRDSEFTRQDLLTRAQAKAEEKRTPVITKEYDLKNPVDGSTRKNVGKATYDTAEANLKNKTQEIADIKARRDKLQTELTEFNRLTTEEPQITGRKDRLTEQLAQVEKDQKDFLDKTELETRTRVSEPATGKITDTQQRVQTPGEEEQKKQYRTEIATLKENIAVEQAKLTRLAELRRLNALPIPVAGPLRRMTLQEQVRAAEAALATAEAEQEALPQTQSRDVPTVPDIVKQIDFITGTNETGKKFVDKLNGVFDIFKDPVRRTRALTSLDALGAELYGVADDAKKAEFVKEKLLGDNKLLVQDLIKILGIPQEDMAAWGLLDGTVRPPLISEFDAREPTFIRWDRMTPDRQQQVIKVIFEPHLMGLMRSMSAAQNIRVGMTVHNERLYSASIGDPTVFGAAGIEVAGNVWLTDRS